MEESRLRAEEKSFRIYVTDILKAMCEGNTLERRWVDLVDDAPDFDAEAVAESVISRAGLVVRE